MRWRSSSSTTLATSAGASALTTKFAGSGVHGMMSIFSPCSSLTTACKREPRIPRHRLHLDDAVVDFRHLLGEQLGHELGMRARKKYLRPARLTAHVVDEGTDAVAVAERFSRQHFVAAHDRLAAAEIDDHVAVFHALDDAVDDVADAVLVFLILAVALGLAHLLHDHLLGRLGGDAAVLERRQGLGDIVPDLG